MAGSMHFQTTGFITSAHPQLSESTPRVSKIIYIKTWLTGYTEGIAEANRALHRGDIPLLLKLASQDSPEHEVWRKIQSRGIYLLSVSNRFAGNDWRLEHLNSAAQKALVQIEEGLADSMQSRLLSPMPQLDHLSTITELTDDERREYLQAIYGNTRDDGVR